MEIVNALLYTGRSKGECENGLFVFYKECVVLITAPKRGKTNNNSFRSTYAHD